MKTYTERGNCARAARVALGKAAKVGIDFTIKGADKAFHWEAITKGEAAPKKKRIKGEAKLQDQPQMQKLIKACHRKDGVTIIELAEILGGVEQHTVRGAISRLVGEGVKITAERTGRRKHFHIEASAE